MRQIREEVTFTKGRITVRGKLVARGEGKRADYILYYKPNIPFAFSTNGDGFVFHDRTGMAAQREANLGLDAFPSPDELWSRYRAWKGFTPATENIVLQD